VGGLKRCAATSGGRPSLVAAFYPSP
jgi:hypothetical protein